MAIIEAISLRKYYNIGDTEVRALDDVSFTIEKGEMVGITGSSGSGKSTLMHILGCLDHPDSGKYILDGQDASSLEGDDLADIRNKHVGFVFQTFNLLARMSAIENVELPLLYAGYRHAKDRAIKALEHVSLANRGHHHPNQLSGGQRQRVAIARALINEPAIILADEPTGNLDSRTGIEIMALFHKLHEQGRTIIIVTHEPAIAKQCSRQINMRDGRIANTS